MVIKDKIHYNKIIKLRHLMLRKEGKVERIVFIKKMF